MADPIPPLTPVKSSNIESIGHANGCLYVQFKGKDASTPGPLWRYRGVAAAHAEPAISEGSTRCRPCASSR